MCIGSSVNVDCTLAKHCCDVAYGFIFGTVCTVVAVAVAAAFGNASSLLAIPFLYIFLALLTVLWRFIYTRLCVCVFAHINMFSELRFSKCQ